jgi:hypothetical protein
MTYTIVPTSEEHIDGFWAALDSVARERKYITFVEGPPIQSLRNFVGNNIKQNAVQFVALVDGRVVGWCDISKSDRIVFQHTGTLGVGVIQEYRGNGIGKDRSCSG